MYMHSCIMDIQHYEKFIEECTMCKEKQVLVQKMFTNGLNMGLPQ